MTNRLSTAMCRKTNILRTYTSFFAVASFFAERTMATPGALVARQGTGTTSFIFYNPPQAGLITCEPFNITWFYSGAVLPLNLVVTNYDVPQGPAPTSTSSPVVSHNTDATNVVRAVPTGAQNPIPLLSVEVAEDLHPYSDFYTWASVDVPQGWYVFSASLPTLPYSTLSDPFFVSNGTDTSCLSSATTTSIMQTSTSPSSSSTATSSSPSPTIAIPVGGASSSSSNVRVIAGLSVAGAFLLALAFAAWFWLYKKRRAIVAKSGPSQAPRRWNGLSSVDSRGGLMGYSGNALQRPHGGSIGTLPMSPSEEGVAAAEKSSIHNKLGGLSPFADGPGTAMTLSALPVLHHDSAAHKAGALARSYSMTSSVSNGSSPHDHGPARAGRRPSVADSLTGRQSIESTGYPPTPSSAGALGRNSAMFAPAPVSRSHSINTSTTHQTFAMASSLSTSSHTSHPQDCFAPVSPLSDTGSPTNPTSPADAAKRNRRSLGATKRKPVPSYDAELEARPPIPASASPSPVPPPSPVPDYAPHYVTRSQAGHDQSQHDLVHKSSFGPGGVEGKPLHYLIPDPPMSLKD